MNKDELLEIYQASLADLRHHDSIYWQAFLAIGVVVPIFIGVVSLLFSSESIVNQDYNTGVKIGILLAAILSIALSAITILRLNSRIRTCKKTLRTIEDNLIELDSNFSKVLVSKGLYGKENFDNLYNKIRLPLYLFMGIMAAVAIVLLLFVVFP